jgi:hypothetical protein
VSAPVLGSARWRHRSKLEAWLAEHEGRACGGADHAARRSSEAARPAALRKRWLFGSELARWLCHRRHERRRWREVRERVSLLP